MIFLNIQHNHLISPQDHHLQVIPCQEYLMTQIPFLFFYFTQLSLNSVPVFPLLCLIFHKV